MTKNLTIHEQWFCYVKREILRFAQNDGLHRSEGQIHALSPASLLGGRQEAEHLSQFFNGPARDRYEIGFHTDVCETMAAGILPAAQWFRKRWEKGGNLGFDTL